MRLKTALKNTSQVKVVNNGPTVEYSWKRRGWQPDIRWLYLGCFSILFWTLTSAAFSKHHPWLNFSWQLAPIAAIGLGIVLLLLVITWKLAKLFIQQSFEKFHLQLSGKDVLVTCWPSKNRCKFDASQWTQLYVSPTEELRAINKQGDHQVVASGPITDLNFLEKELENRLKIQNVRVDGEAWDLERQAQRPAKNTLIQRQETDGRVKVSIPENYCHGYLYPLALIWLLVHCLPAVLSLSPALLILAVLFPTAWVGWMIFYHDWAVSGNRIQFFIDHQNFRMEVGPRLCLNEKFTIPISQITELRSVRKLVKPIDRRPYNKHDLEVSYAGEVKVLCSTRKDPTLLISLLDELSEAIVKLKSQAV
jgi:hypothetical protein